MAKVIISKKTTDISIIAKKVKSKSLKRVYDNKKDGNPTFDGIFLSNNQLKLLGEILSQKHNGPDGVCFMIGHDKETNQKSVELIPYINENNTRKFHDEGNIIGKIHVEVGKPTEESMWSFVIDSEGNFSKWMGAGSPGGSGTSQKTPPPFSG